MTYSEKLKDPRWQKKRLEILNRDEFECRCCFNNTEELHVHHIKYSSDPWDSVDEDLITLCKGCHIEVEKAKKIFKQAESFFLNELKPKNFIETARIVRTIYRHRFDPHFLNNLEKLLIGKELRDFVDQSLNLDYGSKD